MNSDMEQMSLSLCPGHITVVECIGSNPKLNTVIYSLLDPWHYKCLLMSRDNSFPLLISKSYGKIYITKVTILTIFNHIYT